MFILQAPHITGKGKRLTRRSGGAERQCPKHEKLAAALASTAG